MGPIALRPCRRTARWVARSALRGHPSEFWPHSTKLDFSHLTKTAYTIQPPHWMRMKKTLLDIFANCSMFCSSPLSQPSSITLWNCTTIVFYPAESILEKRWSSVQTLKHSRQPPIFCQVSWGKQKCNEGSDGNDVIFIPVWFALSKGKWFHAHS